MKRLNFSNRLKPMAIMAACAMMLSAVSCSNDEDTLLAEFESPGKLVQEIDGEIDFEYLEGLAKGEVMMEYSIKEFESYDRMLYSKWEPTRDDWLGNEMYSPESFIIGRGKCCIPFDMWMSIHHPISKPWEAYRRAVGKDLKLYLEEDFAVPSDDNRQVVIFGRDFILEQFTRDNAVLSHTGEYLEPAGKYSLEIANYRMSDITFSFDETILSYASTEELYKAVIAMLREQFGETINMADWFEPPHDAPTDYSISELESYLEIMEWGWW